MSAASIAAEVEGVGCHTASNWSAWLSSQKEASSKMMHKKACKLFAEDKQTKDMDYMTPSEHLRRDDANPSEDLRGSQPSAIILN